MAPAAQAGKYKRDKDTCILHVNLLLNFRYPARNQDLKMVREADDICQQPDHNQYHTTTVIGKRYLKLQLEVAEEKRQNFKQEHSMIQPCAKNL